jgi:hypothetical protein
LIAAGAGHVDEIMDAVRTASLAYAAGRLAFGAGLVAATARVAGPWLGEDARRPGATQLAVRGLGGRDLVLAAGLVGAALTGAPLRPWLVACAAGDAIDLAATLAVPDGQLPPRSKPGTAALAGTSGAIGAALAVAA